MADKPVSDFLKSTPPPKQPPRTQEEKLNRDPAREIPAEERYEVPESDEDIDYVQVLRALVGLDPLAQELMIAQRLGAMPSQRDGGMPVNIPRMVRPAWASNLRKLGIFCIPELATHELVAPDGTGVLVNHTAGSMRKIDRKDIWNRAKEMHPELGKLVDNAKTPEQKREAMKVLAAQMPAEQRLAVERIMATTPQDLEPR